MIKNVLVLDWIDSRQVAWAYTAAAFRPTCRAGTENAQGGSDDKCDKNLSLKPMTPKEGLGSARLAFYRFCFRGNPQSQKRRSSTRCAKRSE